MEIFKTLCCANSFSLVWKFSRHLFPSNSYLEYQKIKCWKSSWKTSYFPQVLASIQVVFLITKKDTIGVEVAESSSSSQTGCTLARGGLRGCRTPVRWCGHDHDMGAKGSSVCASIGGRGHWDPCKSLIKTFPAANRPCILGSGWTVVSKRNCTKMNSITEEESMLNNLLPNGYIPLLLQWQAVFYCTISLWIGEWGSSGSYISLLSLSCW